MNALFLLWLALFACTSTPAPAPAMDAAAIEPLRAAMTATESIRQALAADTLDGVPAAAEAVADRLRDASDQAGVSEGSARAGIEAAEHLRDATELPAARAAFAELSEALFGIAASDPRLQAGWATYRCPMVSGFGKWFQPAGEMANPYMGAAMLTCGSAEGWGPAAMAEPSDDIAWHTCPMHPSIRSEDPDAPCPICGMDLVPVTFTSLRSGEVLVDGIRRQALGIRTAPAQVRTLDARIDAVGVVQVDERARTVVTARVEGYVERLRVAEVGQVVRAGQPLLELYSPELYATQQDLIRASADGGRYGADLAASARRRLELWGLTAGQIDGVVASGQPLRAVPILAPASGTVISKDVVQGARIMAGERLFELADLSAVWIEARVFEGDADRVAPGQPVLVTLESGGLTRSGQIDRVLPVLDEASRSAGVRIALDNPGDLRVGAYVQVAITPPSEPGLLIPRDAVILAGQRRIVFVDRGDDRLVPTDVRLGRRGPELVEVSEGLVEGDHVVVSGNFLVAAESRLQAATGFWSQEASDGQR